MSASASSLRARTDRAQAARTHGFDDLYEAHVAVLMGSLLDGLDDDGGGARYAWSSAIPDPTLNFATGCRSARQIAWALDAAHRRGRDPAFLARDAEDAEWLRARLGPEAVYPARWMLAEVGALPHASHPTELTRHAEPETGFCDVFGALSDDPRICEHVRRYYVPSLRAGRPRADVEAVHLVLHDHEGPAACASLYIRNELAGLYNVSTRADRQRRGLGAAITRCALAEVRALGASHVFLQCPADGFVESLYARAGFRAVCSPSLVCVKAP